MVSSARSSRSPPLTLWRWRQGSNIHPTSSGKRCKKSPLNRSCNLQWCRHGSHDHPGSRSYFKALKIIHCCQVKYHRCRPFLSPPPAAYFESPAVLGRISTHSTWGCGGPGRGAWIQMEIDKLRNFSMKKNIEFFGISMDLPFKWDFNGIFWDYNWI